MRLPPLPSALAGSAFALPERRPTVLLPEVSAPSPAQALGLNLPLFPQPDLAFDSPFASLPDVDAIGSGEFPELGFGDLEVKFDDPTSVLKPHLIAVAEKAFNRAKELKTTNQVMQAALSGKSLEQQRQEAFQAAAGARADELAAQMSGLDDEQFAQQIERLRAAAGSPPQMPERAPLEAPNLQQSLLALVGALMNPRYAADIAASPFLAQLQQQAMNDQRLLQQFQVDQGNFNRNLELAQTEAELFNRRDVTRAQLEAQREGQTEATLRAATGDLNSGNGSVAQMTANLAQLRATYERLGMPLPQDWEETEASLLSEAAAREKEAADLKRMREQGLNDRARLNLQGRLDIQRMRSQDNQFDELMRMANGNNPEARMVAAQRLRENYPIFEGLEDSEIARISSLTPNERRADEAAKTDSATRDEKVRGEKLKNDERSIDIQIKEIRKQFIKPEYEAKLAQIYQSIAKSQADTRQADERIRIAAEKGGDALGKERKKAVDKLRMLEAEAQIFKPQLDQMESGKVDASDSEIAALRKLLGKNQAARVGLQRQIGRIDNVQQEVGVPSGAPKNAPATNGLFGINPATAQERALIEQARRALAAGKDKILVRETLSKAIRGMRGK